MSNSSNNRIAKNTLFLYFRMLLTMCVSLYTSRVILRILGVEDFGINNVVGGIVAMFGFMNGSLSSATARFLTFELGTKNMDRLKKVFVSSLAIHLILAILIVILAETIGLWFFYNKMVIPEARLDAAMWVFQLSILSTFVMVTFIPFNSTLISHEKMDMYAYISIFDVVAKLAIVYLLTIIPFDKLKLYVCLFFAVQMFDELLYVTYSRRHFKEARFSVSIDKGIFREIFSFAGWNMIGNLAYMGFTTGVNLVLNVFFGPVVNAARGIAVQVQTAISSFTTNFQMAMNPQITKSYASKDFQMMHRLIFTGSKFSFFLLFFLSLPVFFETYQILSWWLGTIPAHTVNFIRLMLMISLIDTLANPVIVSSHATGQIRNFNLVVGSILLLIVPISYWVLTIAPIPELVFIVHFFMVIVAQIARLVILKKYVGISLKMYIDKIIVRVVPVILFSLILPSIIFYFMPPSFVRFICIGFACVLSVGFSVYYIGLDFEEKRFINDKMLVIKNKIFNTK